MKLVNTHPNADMGTWMNLLLLAGSDAKINRKSPNYRIKPDLTHITHRINEGLCNPAPAEAETPPQSIAESFALGRKEPPLFRITPRQLQEWQNGQNLPTLPQRRAIYNALGMGEHTQSIMEEAFPAHRCETKGLGR